MKWHTNSHSIELTGDHLYELEINIYKKVCGICWEVFEGAKRACWCHDKATLSFLKGRRGQVTFLSVKTQNQETSDQWVHPGNSMWHVLMEAVCLHVKVVGTSQVRFVKSKQGISHLIASWDRATRLAGAGRAVGIKPSYFTGCLTQPTLTALWTNW